MKSITSSCSANGSINLCHSLTFPVYCGPLFLVCFGVECACFLFLFYFEGPSPCVFISLYILSLSCPPSFGFPNGIISDCHFKCHPLCLALLFWSVTAAFFCAFFTSPSWSSDLKRSPVFFGLLPHSAVPTIFQSWRGILISYIQERTGCSMKQCGKWHSNKCWEIAHKKPDKKTYKSQQVSTLQGSHQGLKT